MNSYAIIGRRRRPGSQIFKHVLPAALYGRLFANGLNRDNTFLIRNYDYNPALFEGNIVYTHWLKPVMGMSDCTWGLLDGMNADGLLPHWLLAAEKYRGKVLEFHW